MKLCTEIIKKAVIFRHVGDIAALIFAPSEHPQYDFQSSHMAVCKQAAGTHKCLKVVIRLCKGSMHNTLTFICEKELLSLTALYMAIDYPYLSTCDQVLFPDDCLLDLRWCTESINKLIKV